MSQQRILEHLAVLIACDSQNPPRRITPEAEMFVHAKQVLEAAGFTCRLDDYGDGHVNLYARRGQPRVLFNCHLDTVPVGEGWTRPPLALTVENERAYGRGSCDIKGAAAVLLALTETSRAPMALLFSSDEEGGGGCCVQNFLDHADLTGLKQVVVCEPTQGRAVLAHRGFLSVRGEFAGVAGHSSELRALKDSAIHRLVRWAEATLAWCESEAAAGRPTCFNLGVVDALGKSNVIAGEARLHYSARLAPGQSNEKFLEAVSSLAGADQWAEWVVPFRGSPLPAAGQSDAAARAFCAAAGLELAPPVDFWTEAALFSAAGLPVMVLGPGDIAQAHTADEWVALSELEKAFELYNKVIKVFEHG